MSRERVRQVEVEALTRLEHELGGLDDLARAA
jgi:DNA-directed RNA polymerase sigma subunit (sigma70/sigma32)